MDKFKRAQPWIAAALVAWSATATAENLDASELSDLSLEQLSNVVVTSVSRQEERLSNVAASIYIIDSSDIRRSGVRSLPEALRLAPNLQVARVDARNYAITARGFNSPFANKLLVLIDGRSVYSPLFSGVFWDAQDLVTDDIERIEVISGPGSTIWGANAVNGVINIITKSAKDTLGGRATVAAGKDEHSSTVRYGDSLGSRGNYRVYAKYTDVDDTYSETGVNTQTGFNRRQAGFRTDWDLDQGGLTVSGDAYQGALGQIGTRDIKISGANMVASMDGRMSDGSQLRVQLMADHTERNQPNAFVERLDTLDLELQHNVQLGQRHRLSWGGGYRYAQDQLDNGPAFGFLPADLKLHTGNLFAQDEITLTDKLRLTAGVKAEHNNYTGAEFLPNLRLAYAPAESSLVWGSLSRTVRAPSRIDRDLYSPTVPRMVNGVPRFAIAGGPNFNSETAKVAEIGFRAQPAQAFSYAVTGFYSKYDDLRTLEPGANGLEFRNFGEGRVRGVELWGRWHPLPTLRISGGLVVQDIGTTVKSGSRDSAAATGLATNDPERRWLLRVSKDFGETVQLDATLRYASRLPSPAVPAYYEMDMRAMWQVRPNLDISLVGQNLLHASHRELGGAPGRSVYERGALLQLTQRF